MHGSGARTRLERPVHVKPHGLFGRAEILRFVYGRTYKDVVTQSPRPALALAAQAHDGTCETFVQKVLAAWAAHTAMIQTEVDLLPAGTQSPAQFVAGKPATFGQQAAFAIKTAHGVAPANAELVLHGQAREAVLPAPLTVPAQLLLAQREGGIDVHIGCSQSKARSAFAKQLFRRGLRAPGTCAAFVGQCRIQAGSANVLAGGAAGLATLRCVGVARPPPRRR